jgi:hypothetical protein
MALLTHDPFVQVPRLPGHMDVLPKQPLLRQQPPLLQLLPGQQV